MLMTETVRGSFDVSVADRATHASASPATLLMLLLAADALFVALHVSQLTTPFVQDARFSLELDRGFAETYQYVKEYWAALLLLLAGLKRRTPLFVAWAFVFAYLMADDAFMLHERVGGIVGSGLQLPEAFPVRAQHVGEALVLGAVSGLSLALIALAWLGADAGAARASWRLLRLVALLAFFGVGVDMVHEMVAPGFWHRVLGIVEDGGEMVVLSVIVALVADLRGATGLAVPPTPDRAA